MSKSHDKSVILETLHKTAEEFGDIAKRVNISSKLRKTHSEEAIKFITQSKAICLKIVKEIISVNDGNIKQRNQNSVIYNMCKTMNLNIEKQLEVLEGIKSGNVLDEASIKIVETKINELYSSIKEATDYIEKIITRENEIIFLDNEVIMSKELQRESIEKLYDDTLRSLEDAENAIKGSASNLERGLKMVEKYQSVEKIVEAGNRKELNELYVEANRGWNIAVNVNKSSIAQLEFAEKVNKYTQQLHRYSHVIKKYVIDKHQYFEQNLQDFTVLTIILSVKFKKYLDIKKAVSSIDDTLRTNELFNKFLVLMNIMCKDIIDITSLNYNMTDNSHINNENETRTVEMTEEEIEIFEKIKDEVEFMTEATRFPIEGSNKNITNGQVIEQLLKQLTEEVE